jgi:two-component system, chemotaxis family, sensor kinase Cph1
MAPVTRPTHRRRVLVVDDDRDTAEAVATLLSTRGWSAGVVYDGPAAVRAAGADPPDAVVLDLGLPGMDGLAVARALRRMPALRTTVIVAATGYVSEGYRTMAAACGCDHFLPKPYSDGALVDALQRVPRLAPRRRRASVR